MDRDWDAASLALGGEPSQDHQATIRRLDEFERLYASLAPRIGEFLEAVDDRGRAAAVQRHIRKMSRRVKVQLGLRRPEFRRRIPVALTERVERLAHDLHVLLRHRPRSISRSGPGHPDGEEEEVQRGCSAFTVPT